MEQVSLDYNDICSSNDYEEDQVLQDSFNSDMQESY